MIDINEESYTAQTNARVFTAMNIAPITFLYVSLRSPCTDLHFGGSLEAIGDSTRPHLPPKYSGTKLTRSTHIHVSTAFFMCIHAPPHARSALANISPIYVIIAMSPTAIIVHHLLTSPTTSVDVIVDRLLTFVAWSVGLTLTVALT